MTPFCLLLVGGQFALLALASTSDGSFWTTVGLIVAGVLTFLTTLITLLSKLYTDARDRRWNIEKDERDRRWKIEDAAEKARIAEAALEQARLAEEHEKAAQEGRKMLAEKIDAGIQKIDENTQLTKNGIEVANNYNDKIRAAHEMAAAALAEVKHQTPPNPISQ